MSSHKSFLTSNIQDSRIKRIMPRKRIEPIFINGKLLVDVPDPVNDRIKAIKRELGGIIVERFFTYVFNEKVILSVEDTKEAIRMGITIEREVVVMKRG